MSPFTIEKILLVLGTNMNRVIVFFMLAGTVVFLGGIVRYITAGGDENETENARRFIMYGIIGLSVMIAVWGFVAIIIDFIFNTKTIPNIPGGSVVNPL